MAQALTGIGPGIWPFVHTVTHRRQGESLTAGMELTRHPSANRGHSLPDRKVPPGEKDGPGLDGQRARNPAFRPYSHTPPSRQILDGGHGANTPSKRQPRT